MRQAFFLCFISLFLSADALAKQPFHIPGLNAIYGVDDRELITNKTAPLYRELARSVALIVSNDLVETGLLKTTISGEKMESNFGVCSDERFSQNITMPGCTGFLIAPDLMVSAGHCFPTAQDCESKKIIFDVDSKKQTASGYSVLSKNVYSCKEIVASGFGFQQDFALIRLKKTVNGRPFLKIRSKGKIEDSAMVFMIGHPYGLPLTLSNAEKINNNVDESNFKVGLDSFESNSGSPVFNAKTLEVEGLLVNGQQDLVLDPEKQCYRNEKHESGGEGVYRITGLAKLVY